MKSMLYQMNSGGILEFVEILFFTRDLCATSQLFIFESSRQCHPKARQTTNAAAECFSGQTTVSCKSLSVPLRMPFDHTFSFNFFMTNSCSPLQVMCSPYPFELVIRKQCLDKLAKISALHMTLAH